MKNSMKNSKNETNFYRSRASMKDKHKGDILDKKAEDKIYKL